VTADKIKVNNLEKGIMVQLADESI